MQPPWTIKQDCLLYTGALASGKTTAILNIIPKLKAYGISFKIFHDFKYLRKQIILDSLLREGKGHYHPEFTDEDGKQYPRVGRDKDGNVTGHSLEECREVRNRFTITKQGIIATAYTKMFTDINEAPFDNSLKLIECAVGTNRYKTLGISHVTEDSDFSAVTLLGRYMAGSRDTDIRHRLRGVIHPVVKDNKNEELNQRRSKRSAYIEPELSAEFMGPTVMNMISEDDLYMVEELFSGVINIENEGISPSFTDSMYDFVEYQLIAQYSLRELVHSLPESELSDRIRSMSQAQFDALGKIMPLSTYVYEPDEIFGEPYMVLAPQGAQEGLVLPQEGNIDLSLRRRI